MSISSLTAEIEQLAGFRVKNQVASSGYDSESPEE